MLDQVRGARSSAFAIHRERREFPTLTQNRRRWRRVSPSRFFFFCCFLETENERTTHVSTRPLKTPSPNAIGRGRGRANGFDISPGRRET
jgi:hypothetical protein